MMRAATIPDSVLKILKNVPNLPEDTKLATYQSALTLIAIAKSDLQIIAAACKGAAKECGMVDIPTKKMLDALSEKKPPH